MEEEVLKIINSRTCNCSACKQEYVTKIDEMTCKHYFEFAEWLFMREDHFFGKVENQKTLMFVNFAEGSKKKYTIEEVYDYWLKLPRITTKDLTDDDQARAER
jgi:hypothetical protein